MPAAPRTARSIGWSLVGVFLVSAVTAPWNPLLAPRSVLVGFLVLILVLGMAMTLYGVFRAWPAETGVLPGSDPADDRRASDEPD